MKNMMINTRLIFFDNVVFPFQFAVIFLNTERSVRHAEKVVAAAERVGGRVEIEIIKDRNHYGTINKMTETNDPAFLRIWDFIKETPSN